MNHNSLSWTRNLSTSQTKPPLPINPIVIGRQPNPPPNLTPITHQSSLPSLQPLPGLSFQNSKNPTLTPQNTTTPSFQSLNQNYPPPIQIPQQAPIQQPTQNQGTHQITQQQPWNQQNTAVTLSNPYQQNSNINFGITAQIQQQPQQQINTNQLPQQFIPNQFSQTLPQFPQTQGMMIPNQNNMITPNQNNMIPNFLSQPQNPLLMNFPQQATLDNQFQKSQLTAQFFINNTPPPQMEEEFNQLTEKLGQIFEPIRKNKLDDNIRVKFQQINAPQLLQEFYDLNETQKQTIHDYKEFVAAVSMIEHFYKEGQAAQKVEFDRLRSFITLNDTLHQAVYMCNRNKEKFWLPESYYDSIMMDFESQEQQMEPTIINLICQDRVNSKLSTREVLDQKLKDLNRLIKYQQLLLSRVRSVEERVATMRNKATNTVIAKYISIDEDLDTLEQLLK